MMRRHLKIRIFVQDQGEAEDQPAGIHKYVEDLRRGINADIGRKAFFKIASANFGLIYPEVKGQRAQNDAR
jgi:hypothetical protein